MSSLIVLSFHVRGRKLLVKIVLYQSPRVTCTYSVPSAVCSDVGTTLVLSALIDYEERKIEHLKQPHFYLKEKELSSTEHLIKMLPLTLHKMRETS